MSEPKSRKRAFKRRILFVCTGNTCRSAMAEIILRMRLKAQGIEGYISTSAGLRVNVGDVIHQNAVAALKRLGYGNRKHTAKRLTDKMLKNASVIVCMTAAHKAAIGAPKNAYTAAEITGKHDVPDPFGSGVDEYVAAAEYLTEVADGIIEVIKETESREKSIKEK